jgi:hypothetical protein
MVWQICYDPNTFACQNTDPMKQSKHNTNSKQKAQKHNKHFTKIILVYISIYMYFICGQIIGDSTILLCLYNIYKFF